MLYKIFYLFLLVFITSCSSNQIKSPTSQYDKSSVNQFAKTDFDRMADLEIRENMESLKILALKFYKRNPSQLKKSTQDNAEKMVNWIFHGDHNNEFEQLQNKKDVECLNLVFDESFNGDRVLALMTGLKTMLLESHGNKTDFYLFDKLDPQNIYNVARNIEVVVWKLSTKKMENGEPFLISNSISGNEQNLSFEREFGKIIGRSDYFAYTLSEKTERTITRAVQSVSTRLFLPFI
ncbi:MAG: hypothetical protein EBW04_01190 [Betaproteobacteria bacterium]|nr:hypothetical protein [Betaproteobacteria bacterium]